MPPVSPPRAWAEIDLAALRHNLGVAREVSGCRVMAVVKAGAYGHGLEEIARVLADEDIAFFGVANVGEARRISNAGIDTRIYLLGATWSEERAEIVDREWTPCLSSLDEARHFSDLATSANKRLKCHLAVDTGMGRGGFVPEELPCLLPELEALKGIEIEGVGSHLPSADEDENFTREQFTRFAEIVAKLGGRDRFEWIHLSNSAGLLGYDNSPCNLVRPGLMLYGISPLPGHQQRLRNVMSLKSRVTLIRELPAGHGVSYGREFITERPTRVATVGAGYGDGYPRSLSGKGTEVVIQDRRFPLLGRVTMDQIMIDVTDTTVEVGDEVELFGPDVRVDELAAKAGTIAWEILTGITPRVTRVHRS
ncbi:alanine racemase [Haloferula helveola]|uniref:Alanine racemase n=1 Tax=Haloferula helveola TaxID=490095 RepID=A0ABM7RJK3_9BACT|nr:alanine racemase [Haloferula helveola]